MKSILALGAAVLACGAPADPAPVWDAPPPAQSQHVAFVAEDDELYAIMQAADDAWSIAGVRPNAIVVLAPGAPQPGALPAVWGTTEKISGLCMPGGGTAIGCMRSDALWVSNDADPDTLALIARHEMGHALRLVSEPWHLECADPTTATMCDGSRASELTAADAAFICSSATHPCD